MATFNETIVYLLARLIQESSGKDFEQVMVDCEEFWKEAHKDRKVADKVSQEDIDKIYKLYPAKCPFRGTATGKCDKNKAQIETWIRKIGTKELYFRVNRYVQETTRDKVYFKNFSTLLNNLPEYDMPKTIIEEQKKNIFNWQ